MNILLYFLMFDLEPISHLLDNDYHVPFRKFDLT